MHSFQAGCEWFSRSQDGDIPPLLTGRERYLGGIGGWRHSAVAHKCNLNVLRRVNLRRVTADAGRERYLGGIGRIVRKHCLFEHALLVIYSKRSLTITNSLQTRRAAVIKRVLAPFMAAAFDFNVVLRYSLNIHGLGSNITI
ncbi:hypothetical protein SAMN05421736_112111 [Evansella caseinilytica]|uniref:Uncharacterized protein n=1 Tax=Evansella caseinilytica TaxID=1503961 RepID=A0A1H3SX10_9BACI|nr:hypothetical protein [Evansella caseinilytica]SDZ42673.1 hypothetical protein SAMN05421736_112111 [Evansella caseinilytica]